VPENTTETLSPTEATEKRFGIILVVSVVLSAISGYIRRSTRDISTVFEFNAGS